MTGRMTGRATTVLALAVLAGSGVAATVPAQAAAHTPLAGAVPAVLTEAERCEEGVTRWVTETPAVLERLSVPASWRYATGRGVTVAVIDSGIAAANDHFPDDAVLDGESFVEGPATEDGSGHGTAVAGVIAARRIDQSGVVGVAPASTLLPVRVLGERSDQELTPALLARAIDYATEQGAQVINLSMSTTSDDPALAASVRAAQAAGALVVASGGNLDSSDEDPGVRYPAAYDGVLGVAATGPDERAVDNAVAGAHIDLAAPAYRVATTFLADGDCILGDEDSASFATAYVSGAAALVAERFPEEDPQEWAARLLTTASREQRAERTDAVGWGIVQPLAALTLEVDGSLTGPLPGDAGSDTETAGGTVDLTPPPDPAAASRTAAMGLGLAGLTLTLALALIRLLRR